nr:hypothetical protein MACL_00002514 [Theileria orientalis]
MDKCIIFKSLLLFLLLCYGKKFIDANESQKTKVLSQQESSTSLSQKQSLSFPHAHLNSNQSAGSSSTTFSLDDDVEPREAAPRGGSTSGPNPQPRQRVSQTGGSQGAPKQVTISLDDDEDMKPQAQNQSQPQGQPQAQATRQVKAVPVDASASSSPQPRQRVAQTGASQGAPKQVSISLDDDEDMKPQAQNQSQPQGQPQAQTPRQLKAVPVEASATSTPQPRQQPPKQGPAPDQGSRQIKAIPVAAAPIGNQPKQQTPTATATPSATASPSTSSPQTIKFLSDTDSTTDAESGTDIELHDTHSPASPTEAKAQQDSKADKGTRDPVPQPEAPSKKPIVKPSRIDTIASAPLESDAGSDIDLSVPSPPAQPQAQVQQAQPQARTGPSCSTSSSTAAGSSKSTATSSSSPTASGTGPLNISEPVEITTSTPTNLISVNDRTKFSFEEYTYGFLFKFTNNNRCVELKYGGKEVWKYSANPENVYPKSICLRKDTPVILFEFEGCYYLYGCVENKFKFIHYDEFYAVYNKIKVITQHYGQLYTNNSKAYDVIHYGLMFEYRFKHNHLCTEVKYNDKVAWSYDNLLYGDNFPTVLYFDVISPIIMSVFIQNTPHVFINHNDEWKSPEEVMKMQDAPVLPSTLPATPSSPSLKSIPLASSGKTIEIVDSELEGPASVAPPRSTHDLPDTDVGSDIELADSASVIQTPKPAEPRRQRAPFIKPVQVQQPTTTTAFDEDGVDLNLTGDIEVTELRHPTRPKRDPEEGDFDEFLLEPKDLDEDTLFVHRQPVKLVSLDIQDTQTTRFINYSYDVITKTHIYTPKPSYSISEVKMDDYVFWKATNDNYGFGVIFIENLNNKPFLKVFIPEKEDLADEEKAQIIEKEIFERTGQKPSGPPEADDVLIPLEAPASEQEPHEQEDSTQKKMPILVDIKKKDSTEQYEYSKRNSECGMYTPKHNFIFKLVKAGRMIGSDVEIWCPESEDEYVSKVFIDLIGILSNTFNVTLFLVNGNVKHFTLLNDRWIEVDPATLLDISKTQSTYEYDVAKDERNDIVTFTPRGHFLFKGVKRTQGLTGLNKSVVDIWNAMSKCDYARKAVVKSTKKAEKYLLLYLIGGGYKLFYRSHKGKIWRDESTNLSSFNNLKTYGIDLDQESMDKVVTDKYLSLRMTDGLKIPVTLNIDNKKNTNEFYYLVNGPIVSYVPKHNIVFDNVVFKSNVFDVAIWNAADAYQYAYRVVMGNNPWNPYKKRSMALILLNGNFTFFEEFEDYVDWRNTTDTRYSLLNLKMYTMGRDMNGRYRQIESGEFKINSLAFLYGYTFNPGVECLEIRYRNLPIWKYSDNPRGGFPRGIYLNIANNGFYIKYFDRWMFVDMDIARAKYAKATPTVLKTQPETPKTYALSCPLLVTNIRVTTMIGDKPFVHNLTHFTLLEGYLVSTFDFIEKLIKVEYADKIVWKHKIIRYGTRYPNKLYFDHLGYLIVSFTDNWYYVYEYSVEMWKIVCKNEIDKPDDLPGMAIITDEVQPLLNEHPSFQIPSMPEPPEDVEQQHINFQAEVHRPTQPPVNLVPPADKSLITLDLQVLSDDRYEISYSENKVVYRARAPNLFRMVKSGNDILWQASRNEYPYKVIYKEVDGKDKLKVFFPTDESPILGKIRSERR